MVDFRYRAADGRGGVAQGQLGASSREEALRILRSKGLLPIAVELAEGKSGGAYAGGEGAGAAARLSWRKGGAPGQQDVHGITSELSVMLRAGLSLDRALRILKGMSRKPSVVGLLDDLLAAVKSGKALSQALQSHQELFGDFYINMVRSGELGGQLAEVMGRLAEHMERVKALRESVVSALIYPAILVLVACVSVVLMLGFVVPQFETLFEDMGEALPLPTRIIIAAGHLVTDWGGLGVAVGGVMVWGLRRWLRAPSGRLWVDRRLLELPVLGALLRRYELTRFVRTMGTLLGCGVPIVTAFRIALETMGSAVMRQKFEEVPVQLKQGGRLGDALDRTGLLSPLALNMIRLGEETGRLDAMLMELARIQDADVQTGVKRALTLLEPMLILVLGGVVAAIIVSILLGILSVNDLVG